MMKNPKVPFLDIVETTLPYLVSRSAAGTLMTVGHVAFAILVARMGRDFLLQRSQRPGPTLLGRAEAT
jgi:cytochrome c oxidase cbb3-type subunit 1